MRHRGRCWYRGPASALTLDTLQLYVYPVSVTPPLQELLVHMHVQCANTSPRRCWKNEDRTC
eukprot:3957703-Prymnesium_polylepis.1